MRKGYAKGEERICEGRGKDMLRMRKEYVKGKERICEGRGKDM